MSRRHSPGEALFLIVFEVLLHSRRRYSWDRVGDRERDAKRDADRAKALAAQAALKAAKLARAAAIPGVPVVATTRAVVATVLPVSPPSGSRVKKGQTVDVVFASGCAVAVLLAFGCIGGLNGNRDRANAPTPVAPVSMPPIAAPVSVPTPLPLMVTTPALSMTDRAPTPATPMIRAVVDPFAIGGALKGAVKHGGLVR